MTLVQLEYVVAVDTWRHFALAAEKCFVTQPSLSMQLQKLEEELDFKIFDRSKHPVIPTLPGESFIIQARKILMERDVLLQTVKQQKGILSGELRIGIIPTLAPYLLPLFVSGFLKKYPEVKLVIHEMMTSRILDKLKQGKLDAGILVTPLQENGIQEHVLFYEELNVYVSKKNAVYQKQYVLPEDIDPHRLWLLEEGHCFRSQIMNLCELQKMSKLQSHFEYEAGSIETLRKMVEINEGITIIPEMATFDMNAKQLQLIRKFKKPVPMREVSLAVHRNQVKESLIQSLKKEILNALPDKLKQNKASYIVAI